MNMTGALSSYPGFKFAPTEQELVLYYLRKKIEGFEKCVDVISEIDITTHEPWDLPEKSIIPSTNEWYFFSARGRKYPKGLQSKRGTDSGYWKATGKERNVKSGNRIIGTKRTLVFHKGRAPKGKRTEWIMHEYCMSGTPQESFVVCRVRKNCEFDSSDIPPNEINQSPTGDSSTCNVVDDIQQNDVFNGHNDSNGEYKDNLQGFTPPDKGNIPHPVERFDSEYDKKPRSLNLQHSIDCFDCDKKPGNPFLQDESCSSPKFQGYEGVADDYFDDILNDDIIKLDGSSLLLSDIPANDTLNKDFTGSKFEQLNEIPPLPLPFQGTAPRRIRLTLHTRIRPINPLPLQGTAPQSNTISCHLLTTMSDVTVNHRRVMVLVVLVLLAVFLAAPLTRYWQRHHY